jgi:hypothetical protein
MNNKKILIWSFLNSLGVLIYVSAIAFLLNNGEKVFGKMMPVWGAVGFLMLFVVSALITGLLVLGRPVYLFLDGFKKEAVKMLIFTVGWMFVITVLALVAGMLLR